MKVDLKCFLLLSLNSFNEVCMVAVLSSSFFSLPLILSILLSTFFYSSRSLSKSLSTGKGPEEFNEAERFQIHSVVGLVAWLRMVLWKYY